MTMKGGTGTLKRKFQKQVVSMAWDRFQWRTSRIIVTKLGVI